VAPAMTGNYPGDQAAALDEHGAGRRCSPGRREYGSCATEEPTISDLGWAIKLRGDRPLPIGEKRRAEAAARKKGSRIFPPESAAGGAMFIEPRGIRSPYSISRPRNW